MVKDLGGIAFFDKEDKEEINKAISELSQTDLSFETQAKILGSFVLIKSRSYYKAGAKWGVLKLPRKNVP